MTFILPPEAKIVFHQKTEISVGEKVFMKTHIEAELPSGEIISYDCGNFPDDLEWFSDGGPSFPAKISPGPFNPFPKKQTTIEGDNS